VPLIYIIHFLLLSIHNTLYLDVICPSVKPELIRVDDEGEKRLDFGKISVGQRVVRKVDIKNISQEKIDVSNADIFIFEL
jgi:hypothetical protein